MAECPKAALSALLKTRRKWAEALSVAGETLLMLEDRQAPENRIEVLQDGRVYGRRTFDISQAREAVGRVAKARDAWEVRASRREAALRLEVLALFT